MRWLVLGQPEMSASQQPVPGFVTNNQPIPGFVTNNQPFPSGSSSRFAQKQLRFTFDLPAGDSFAEAPGANRMTVSGLRASATITQGGSAQFGMADIAVYGLTLAEMNKLSTLGIQIPMVRRNVVTVEAGDEANGMSVVFQGTITNGWCDFAAMPNNSFRITADPAVYIRVQPVPPTTINGQADVATVLAGLAQQASMSFNDGGVQERLYYPYFPGTILEQIERCARAAGINYAIDHNTLSIWPRGAQRGQLIPIISPDTGMIGYPAFTSLGVNIAVVFNPTLVYGQRVRVQGSALTAANQDWDIISISHDLDAQMPNGQWRTRFIAAPPGLVAIGPRF